MKILKERTRLLIDEYTPYEKKQIDDLVGTMDKVFSYEDPDSGIVGLPTGMEEPLKRLFPKVQIDDQSAKWWPHQPIHAVEHNAQPRNQLQKDFIDFVLNSAAKSQKVAGILSPGTGKTFMACYSAIRVGLRTLIIVPTSGIKVQWGETLVNMFHVDPKNVTVVNSPRDFIKVHSDFVVISQASLAVLNKTYDLEQIIRDNEFGIKVIDEVQMWFHNIIKVDASSNIRHNWYLTGTFGRSADEENRLYQQMFGDLAIFREKEKKPTLFNRKPGNIYGMKPHMNVKMIWTKSGLSKEEIKSVTGSMRYSERAGKWMRYGISIPAYTELVIPSDGTMTRFLRTILNVIKIADNEVRYGKMLILSATIASVDVLSACLTQIFPDKKIGTINSHNSKFENDRVKAECDILVSTVKSCGTGFDVKDLAKLIVIEAYRSWILTDQVSGRLRRRPDGRDTYMWDIVDAQIPQLRAWAHARADVLKRKSKKFTVIDM